MLLDRYISVLNKLRLNKFFLITPNYSLVFKTSTFASSASFLWCDVIKHPIISIISLQSIGTNAINFNRTKYLDEESFSIASNLYPHYIYNKFSNNLSLFRLGKPSENSFSLGWNTDLIGSGKPIQNYIDYLSLMRVSPNFKRLSGDRNYGFNPLNPSPEYEVSISEISCQDKYLMKKVTLPGKGYVEIYKCTNSEYFLKTGFLFKLNDFDLENFEEQLIGEYCMIHAIAFMDRDEPYISMDELNIDIYIVINISKAGEEDWKFLYELPHYA